MSSVKSYLDPHGIPMNRSSGKTNQTVALAVTPLNSIPYMGPPLPQMGPPPPYTNNASTPHNGLDSTLINNDSTPIQGMIGMEKLAGPAMIFMPSNSSKHDWDNLVRQNRSGVALTGSAAIGKIGNIIGSSNIEESEDSYYFRVSLPGILYDEESFSCTVDPDGKVTFRGNIITGEKTVYRDHQVFTMLSQNLGPSGPFTTSIQLPGPVNSLELQTNWVNGILEGSVKKR